MGRAPAVSAPFFLLSFSLWPSHGSRKEVLMLPFIAVTPRKVQKKKEKKKKEVLLQTLVDTLFTGGIRLSHLQVNRTWAPQLSRCCDKAVQQPEWASAGHTAGKLIRRRGRNGRDLLHPALGSARRAGQLNFVCCLQIL